MSVKISVFANFIDLVSFSASFINEYSNLAPLFLFIWTHSFNYYILLHILIPSNNIDSFYHARFLFLIFIFKNEIILKYASWIYFLKCLNSNINYKIITVIINGLVTNIILSMNCRIKNVEHIKCTWSIISI